MKFKKGDRVKLVSDGWAPDKGLKGKVVDPRDSVNIGVEFDKNFGGHNLSGQCRAGHGQWITEAGLKLIKGITMKDTKYGVTWDEDEDPTEFFSTKTKAEERIADLMDKSEVKKGTIYLFEVGKKWKATRPIDYKLESI